MENLLFTQFIFFQLLLYTCFDYFVIFPTVFLYTRMICFYNCISCFSISDIS